LTFKLKKITVQKIILLSFLFFLFAFIFLRSLAVSLQSNTRNLGCLRNVQYIICLSIPPPPPPPKALHVQSLPLKMQSWRSWLAPSARPKMEEVGGKGEQRREQTNCLCACLCRFHFCLKKCFPFRSGYCYINCTASVSPKT
jgi:hypothetical protein